MIPLGDLYCVIVVVYLLQLYWNHSRPLGHIDYGSPLGHLLGHPLGHFLGHSLKYFLGYSLRHPLEHSLGHFLRHPI